MLTKKDLTTIRVLVEEVVEEKLEEKLEQKLEEKLEAKFNEKLANLPTKEEFNRRMDELTGEYKKFSEESVLLSGRTSANTEMIDELEIRVNVLEELQGIPPKG